MDKLAYTQGMKVALAITGLAKEAGIFDGLGTGIKKFFEKNVTAPIKTHKAPLSFLGGAAGVTALDQAGQRQGEEAPQQDPEEVQMQQLLQAYPELFQEEDPYSNYYGSASMGEPVTQPENNYYGY